MKRLRDYERGLNKLTKGRVTWKITGARNPTGGVFTLWGRSTKENTLHKAFMVAGPSMKFTRKAFLAAIEVCWYQLIAASDFYSNTKN